jgi:hypothetical protein
MEWSKVVEIARAITIGTAPMLSLALILFACKWRSASKELRAVRKERDALQKELDDTKLAEQADLRMRARLDTARDYRAANRLAKVLDENEKWDKRGEPITPQPRKTCKKKGELE